MIQDIASMYPEFLAESNIALNQEDENNQLSYIITPIKQLLQSKSRPFTSFALAKSAGAPSQLAFFCEWCSFTGQVLQNLQTLSEYNEEYFVSVVGSKQAARPEITKELAEMARGQVLTMQIAFINQKLEQLRLDTFTRFGEVSRFLTYKQFNKTFSSENTITRTLISPKTTLAQYLDVLGGGFSYYTVGLPIAAGICYSIKEYSDVVDTNKIQWSMLESILKNISVLARTTSKSTLSLFLKEQVVSDKQLWFTAPLSERVELATGDTEIAEQYKQIRFKIFDRTKKDLEYLVLPKVHKLLIEQLLNWSYSLAVSDVNLEQSLV
jgi:hypothetical protein